MTASRSSLISASFVGMLVAFAATPSAANDQYGRPDYAPPIWTGLYVGAHLGYGWSRAEADASGGGLHVGVEAHDNGSVGGIQIGYNWQRGGYVFGIEADYDLFSDLNFGTVRGRLGFLANHVLVYGTAGLAFADSGPDNVVGLVIGAGVEMPVWRNMTIGLEALYYNFEEQSGTVSNGFGGTIHYSADADTFVIRGRLNYHFN
jgi:outer membrane immunogenic protein